MLNTAWQKSAIAIRRDKRDRERDGWEYVGEGGGRLWELYRGSRIGHTITEVAIAVDGLGLWIKTKDQPALDRRPNPSPIGEEDGPRT